MTIIQKYIIATITLTMIIILVNQKKNTDNLPEAIGDPLELIIIKDTENFNNNFYKYLTQFLKVEIGPSPQQEFILSLTEINKEDFKGIFKRHQNLLIVFKSDSFKIEVKKNVFALGQQVIFLGCPSEQSLIDNKKDFLELVGQIKNTEILRMQLAFQKFLNIELQKNIMTTHQLDICLPKDFFLAYSDSAITWVRRELPKSSQGILIANLSENYANLTQDLILLKTDSIIQKYIFGPNKNSHMTLEKEAPVSITHNIIDAQKIINMQTLWRMENDFMGGICNTYFIDSQNSMSPQIIYTYLYAPGEKKANFLLQIESIIQSLNL